MLETIYTSACVYLYMCAPSVLPSHFLKQTQTLLPSLSSFLHQACISKALIQNKYIRKEKQIKLFQWLCIQAERDRLASELDEEREKLGQSKRQEDSVQEALNNSVAIFNQRQDSMQKEIELLKYELVEEQKR